MLLENLLHTGSTISQTVLDLIFPPLCRGCGNLLPGQEDMLLCFSCQNRIHLIHSPVCDFCGAPLPDSGNCGYCPPFTPQFNHAFSACEYRDTMRELVLRFKFRDDRKIHPMLKEILLGGAERFLKNLHIDAIVPVPLHWFKHYRREFNQSEILVRWLSEWCGCPFHPKAIHKTRYTVAQSRLSGKWRKDNLEGVFVPTELNLKGQSLLLVDDVMTSGNTLSSCASVLKQMGAAKVTAYTLCRRLASSSLEFPPDSEVTQD